MILLAETTTEKEKERSERRRKCASTHQHVLEFLNAVVELKHKAIYIPGIYMLMEYGIRLVRSILVRLSRILTLLSKS